MIPRIKTHLSVNSAYGIRINQQMIDSYDAYLENHIISINLAWKQIQKKIDFDTKHTREICYLLSIHDQNKYAEEEYIPYLIHYYFPKTNAESEAAYEAAWERHYSTSPHHWKYWLYKNSPRDVQPKYILEMMLNWHAKSSRYPELTAYNQYQEEKNSILLSSNTRSLIERYIDLFNEPVKIPKISTEYYPFDPMSGSGFITTLPNNVDKKEDTEYANDPRADYAIVDKTWIEE